jgi:hypothetical protein
VKGHNPTNMPKIRVMTQRERRSDRIARQVCPICLERKSKAMMLPNPFGCDGPGHPVCSTCYVSWNHTCSVCTREAPPITTWQEVVQRNGGKPGQCSLVISLWDNHGDIQLKIPATGDDVELQVITSDGVIHGVSSHITRYMLNWSKTLMKEKWTKCSLEPGYMYLDATVRVPPIVHDAMVFCIRTMFRHILQILQS